MMAYKNNNKRYQFTRILILQLSFTLILLSPTLLQAFSIPYKPLILNDDRLHLSARHANCHPNQKYHTTRRLRSSLRMNDDSIGEKDDEESFSSDPASTTAQLLESLWALNVKGCSMTRGESTTINFPEMEESLTPQYLKRIMDHLDQCKDVCDDFGTNTVLSPHVVQQKVAGFTVKSFRSTKAGTLPSDGKFTFAYDPLWDNEEEWDMVEQEIQAELNEEALVETVEKVSGDDEEVADVTKNWCQQMSDVGVCPFPTETDKAGLPIGPVHYTTDRCSSMPEMYRSYWEEVVRVETKSEDQLSTTLLMAPNFSTNAELFEKFSKTLKESLDLLELEKLIQLVFFHPEWDLQEESKGASAAANDALRPPWPMINIVRTNLVRADQRGKSTEIYQQKEVAPEDFQSAQVEGGNMVTMVIQALEKRLTGSEDGGCVELSGTETSAVMMASDFLLGHMDQLMYGDSEAEAMEEEMSAGV